MSVKKFHGREPRGLLTTPQSSFFGGRFGRMFRHLHAAKHTDAELELLGAAMVADAEAEEASEDEIDPEENQGIDAGYTYLGQFIDHDITFDPASSLQKQNDPNALEDFRTPRFDLDNVYGRGPDDQPYLYGDDGLHLLLGDPLTGNTHDHNTRDLPRNNPPAGDRRAIIGDPRNDENVIVSELQSVFIRFHNRMVKVLRSKKPDASFEEIQQCVRWHYQWVILNDFLPTIVGQRMVDLVLPPAKARQEHYRTKPNLDFFKWRDSPFMPVEFSVAAYRFGHSMVRPLYRLNTTLPNRQAIFGSNPFLSLVGFRVFPSSWAIDWNLFFNPGDAPITGINRIQKSYKIDTSLVNPLGSLPDVIARKIKSLATRNLLRGLKMGLPSGQAVARQMNLEPIPDKHLKIGKATEEDSPNNKLLTDISPNFRNNAPLWYYILAEAQLQFKKDSTPITLGPVGGRMVTEVFVGLMYGDKHSYLFQEPTWTPFEEFMNDGKFRMIDLIAQAIKDHDPA